MRRTLRRFTRALLAFSLVSGAVLLIGLPPASAQPPRRPFGQGTHALRNLMKDPQWGLKPITEAAFQQVRLDAPSSLLLIILGEANHPLLTDVDQFVRRGGAALIATDREGLGPWTLAFGTQVAGRFVSLPSSQANLGYRGYAECPFVEPTPRADPPIFAGLKRVATNKPSYLLGLRQSLPTLANLPKGCSSWGGWEPDFLREAREPLRFAAGGEIDNEGRVLVLADHSMFINDMMLRDDNDNTLFAYNCIDWLTDRRKRTNVLFIEEGEVVTTFDVPLRDVPDPPIPPLADMINHVVSGIENRDDVHNFLRDHNVRRDPVLRYALLVVTVGLIGYGLFRLLRARQRMEPQMPLLEATLAQQAPDMPLVEQRHRAMLVDGNLWEAARDLARQCFPAAERRAPAEGTPGVVVTGSWWEQRTLRKQVQRLWQVAHADRPERITALQFSYLAVEAENVRTAYTQGKWRLV
jgi:hypothetical protein